MEVQHEEELLEEIRKLPAEQVREVLDFAIFLRHRIERESNWQQAAKQNAAERMEARRNRIGPIGIKAADLVEQGRAARVATILKEEGTCETLGGGCQRCGQVATRL